MTHHAATASILRHGDSRFDTPALTLDSTKSAAFIEQHGECDLPTRRHAEESRPAPREDAPCR
jgi:hypothetical protein